MCAVEPQFTCTHKTCAITYAMHSITNYHVDWSSVPGLLANDWSQTNADDYVNAMRLPWKWLYTIKWMDTFALFHSAL